MCIHCNSYQDWRGELTFSSTILSLLVALVSVTTAFVPMVLAALTSKNSSIASSFQSSDVTGVTVLAHNSGTRPGTIRNAIISVSDYGSAPLTSKHGRSEILEPGTTKLVDLFSAADDNFPDVPKGDKSTFQGSFGKRKCSLAILGADFHGKPTKDLFDIECAPLVDFFFIRPYKG
jgi:hypothetical protein